MIHPIQNTSISNYKNPLSFKSSFKKDYWEYTKCAHFPSIKAISFLKDKNIKSLLDSKSITFSDIKTAIKDIRKITQDYSLNEILESLKNPNTYKFVSQYKLRLIQAPLVSKLSKEQIDAFENALKELNNPKLEETMIYKLKKQNEYLLLAETQDNYDKEFKNFIYFHIKVSSNGDCQISRLEDDRINNTASRLKNSDNLSIISTEDSDLNEYVSQIIEVKPDCIIHSKISDRLPGVYEITKYNFSDYPQEYDVLSSVQNGTIKGGNTYSSVSEDENYIEYSEKFVLDDTVSKRHYKKSKDGLYRELQYKITRGDIPILDVERSWQKISDNKTVTILNGKKYIADFSNPNKVKITDNQGKVEVINISQKAPSFSFEFIKSLDAISLLNINKYTKEVVFKPLIDDSQYCSISEKIYTQENIFVFSHEMGHAIDVGKYYSEPDFPEKEKRLFEIYKKEFENFNKNNDSNIQKILEYYSQISLSDGLDEIVADTNALLNSYGVETYPQLSARLEMLVRYFPKTIAYCAELLGYNYSTSTLSLS